VASKAFERILSLPLYPKMTEDDIQRVVAVVRDLIETYRR
jgi:perosamine synthetase